MQLRDLVRELGTIQLSVQVKIARVNESGTVDGRIGRTMQG